MTIYTIFGIDIIVLCIAVMVVVTRVYIIITWKQIVIGVIFLIRDDIFASVINM
jgi:hypothetical protein